MSVLSVFVYKLTLIGTRYAKLRHVFRMVTFKVRPTPELFHMDTRLKKDLNKLTRTLSHPPPPMIIYFGYIQYQNNTNNSSKYNSFSS